MGTLSTLNSNVTRDAGLSHSGWPDKGLDMRSRISTGRDMMSLLTQDTIAALLSDRETVLDHSGRQFMRSLCGRKWFGV